MYGRFRYSDLKEAPSWLWVLYVVEPVLKTIRIAVARSAVRLQCVVPQRSVAASACESLHCRAISRSWGKRDAEAGCVLEHEEDARLGMWIHAAHQPG